MGKEPFEKEVLLQNLRDAGLCTEEIEQVVCCHDQNRRSAQLKILTKYRGRLLNAVQESQEKLYCLDHLIRKLRADM